MELKSYKEQINEVRNLVDKMEQGNLSLSELTDLELITRLLHERSIILKYKAFEGNADTEMTTPSISESENAEKSDSETEASDAPFDWNPTTESATEPADLEELEDIIEEEIEEAIEEETTPIIELTEEEMKVETPPSIQDIITEELVAEVKEEMIEQEEVTPPTDNSSFVDKLNLADKSTHTLTMGAKIDTLIGAFGLNEKLRFINDLFDGSSEDFNNAVKLLDSQNNIAEANEKINQLATEQSWDAEDETAAEFVSFINRRYA